MGNYQRWPLGICFSTWKTEQLTGKQKRQSLLQNIPSHYMFRDKVIIKDMSASVCFKFVSKSQLHVWKFLREMFSSKRSIQNSSSIQKSNLNIPFIVIIINIFHYNQKAPECPPCSDFLGSMLVKLKNNGLSFLERAFYNLAQIVFPSSLSI